MSQVFTRNNVDLSSNAFKINYTYNIIFEMAFTFQGANELTWSGSSATSNAHS